MEKNRSKYSYKKEAFNIANQILLATEQPKFGYELKETIEGVTYRRLYFILKQLINYGYMAVSKKQKKVGHVNAYTRIKFYKEVDYWNDINMQAQAIKNGDAPMPTISPNIQVVYANKYYQLIGNYKEIPPVKGERQLERHVKVPTPKMRVYVGSVYNGMML
jgi:hypothetical protein